MKEMANIKQKVMDYLGNCDGIRVYGFDWGEAFKYQIWPGMKEELKKNLIFTPLALGLVFGIPYGINQGKNYVKTYFERATNQQMEQRGLQKPETITIDNFVR